MSNQDTYGAIFDRLLKACSILFGHFLLCMLSIVAVWAIEQTIGFLFHGQDPIFFGVFPMKWLFHLLDIGLILTFGASACFETYSKLKGR